MDARHEAGHDEERGNATFSKVKDSINPLETTMGDQWDDSSAHQGPPMLSREERNPLSDWWWTVDWPLLAAIVALMLSGVVL